MLHAGLGNVWIAAWSEENSLDQMCRYRFIVEIVSTRFDGFFVR